MKTALTCTKLLAALALSGLATSASAITTEYVFGTAFPSTPPGVQPLQAFADLLVTTTDNKNFSFSLTAYNLTSLFPNSATPFIGELAMDLVDPKDANPKKPTAVTGGVSVMDVKKSNGPGGIPADSWDYRYGIGQGNDKLVAGETVTWKGTFEKAVTFANDKFALHVQGVGPTNTSYWYVPGVPAVPEPSTYAMFLAGLGLIGMIVKHRKAG